MKFNGTFLWRLLNFIHDLIYICPEIKNQNMKKLFLFITAGLFLANLSAFGQENEKLNLLKTEFDKAVPSGFKLDESGVDGVNLYLVYKKSPQEIITVNLQQDHRLEFSNTENLIIDGRDAVFYYAGFEKSGGLAITLNEGAGHLIIGYNKPYMGDDIVEMAELTSIAEKVDLGKIE